MGRWLTTRRSEWLPGVAIVGVSTALAILLGDHGGMDSKGGLAAAAFLRGDDDCFHERHLSCRMQSMIS